jgi:cytidine deaminase
MIDWDNLIRAAMKAQENAYARFSEFRVGAALIDYSGNIFTGCNIENSSYGLTICAERTAIFKAVSEGVREFKAIVVFSESSPPARPCGACRQVLFEFSPIIEILCVNQAGARDKFMLSDLLPEGFKLKD